MWPNGASRCRPDGASGMWPNGASHCGYRVPARMSTFLFVLLFVSLGLGTVLIAMRSGSRGPLFDPQKRGGRRAVAWLTALAVLVFAVAIPIAAGGGTSDNQEKDRKSVG